MNSRSRLFIIIVLSLALSGCSGIGRGMVDAFLESEKEDKRKCDIYGKSFDGVNQIIDKAKGVTKLLYVHGVGEHDPGYSTEFMEKLSAELNLNKRESLYKEISLVARDKNKTPLGTLRIHKLMNREDVNRTLLFYELTWSEITRDEKALLAYDNSGEHAFRRAGFNNLLKKFTNDTGPDPLIYLGKSRDTILTSFVQSFCWMGISNWSNIPTKGTHHCVTKNADSFINLKNDEYVFVSHSLGSRISIDGLQHIVSLFEKGVKEGDSERILALHKILKDKEIKMFMLSNQLPMLQLGREDPSVFGEIASYCSKDAAKSDARMFRETSIVAFSDPNDILSYAIAQNFADRYLDSRICPSVTNVFINIAHVNDIFGFGGFANPLTAHVAYDSDDRVVNLIAHGLEGNQNQNNSCKWTELEDGDR
ncbi:MAG: hypothetical protein MJK10_15470 [Pseudomonadales bacterium]|nr:hypothetical protein [Pseudomonadales bacterium]NRA17597.1 hypothetical protein [Oceanospirillaceae bacterium]